MATVHLYCDEAGTMPVRDDDDAFVAAVLALPSYESPDLPERPHSPEVTAKLLRELKAVFQCCKVIPFFGYEKLLAKKIKIWKFTSEVDEKLGRRRRWFTSPDQVRDRNIVWIGAMELALGAILVPIAGILDQPIEGIRVYINAKSFTAEMKSFFISVFKELTPETARSVFTNASANPELAPRWQKLAKRASDNIRPESIDIEWDDQPDFSGNRGLMWLAHSLVSNTHREVRMKDRKHGFFWALNEAGFRSRFLDDVTKLLVKIKRSDYVIWERETGTKIPFL